MVKSRYLCSAPRPETWDERAEALLQSLGGSATQREEMLRKTLDSLRVMHADKQKTGPGRKSNAEHAIAFYEYVLETITEDKEGAGSADEDVVEEDEGEEFVDEENEQKPQPVKPEPKTVPSVIATDPPVKRKRGRPRKIPLPVEEPATTKIKQVVIEKTEVVEQLKKQREQQPPSEKKAAAVDDNSLSIASMDTEEFINQHNDLCEVCNTGGELLMCSTCNLVFHLHHVRPKMDEMPPDSWVCAYCIMSGTKKQNSKARKNAAVAVRLMARERKQLERQKNMLNLEKHSSHQEQQGQQQVAGGFHNSDEDGSESSNTDAEADSKQQQQQQPLSGEVPTVETPDEVSVLEIEAVTSDESQQPAAIEGIDEFDETKTPSSEAVIQNIEAAEGEADDSNEHTTSIDNNDSVPTKSNGEEQVATNGDIEGPAYKEENHILNELPINGVGNGNDEGETPRKGTTEAVADDEDQLYSNTGRVRRNRKQANYYDPQNGAASSWKSDGANEWKYLSQNQQHTSEDDEVDDIDDGSEDVDNTEASAAQDPSSDPVLLTKKGAKKSSSSKSLWCNFCKDDKDIPVCCFCACRVCFGKHDQSKLLLCDNCNSEYHLSCLNPPLKSVPSSQSWFCPSCLAAEKSSAAKVGARVSRTKSSGKKSLSPKAKNGAISKANGKATSPAALQPQPVKRGPGRPRKYPLPDPNAAPPRKRGRPPKTKSPSPEPVIPPQKKRGRPRKNPLPETAAPPLKIKSRGASLSPLPQPVKRGPGRPPASQQPVKRGPGRPPSLQQPVKRGPGRPPKSANKKRGRSPGPRKDTEEKKKRSESKPRLKPAPVKDEEEEEDDEEVFILEDAVAPTKRSPVKTSRSGRKVKRTSFHDEIDEGEQHLKSSRQNYVMEQQQFAFGGPFVASTDLFAIAHQEIPLVAPVVADAGLLHVAHQPLTGVYEQQHHHDVDPHFLESIPVGGGVAHLDALVMDPTLNLDAMHNEAMQMDAAMNLNAGLAQPHAVGGSMYAEEGDTKPAAVVAPHGANVDVSNEVRPAPVVERLSVLPSASLETNEIPTLSTVADTATPTMGNTVPDVGVLVPGVDKVAEEAAAPAQAPALKEKVPTPVPAAAAAAKALPSKSNAVVASEANRKLPANPAVVVPAAVLPSKPDALFVLDAKALSVTPAVAKRPAPMAAAALPKPVSFAPLKPVMATPPAAVASPKAAVAVAANAMPQKLVAAVPAVAALLQPSTVTAPIAAAYPAGFNPASVPSHGTDQRGTASGQSTKVPRRKPGARECMQISRRFGVNVIPDKWMDVLLDYCKRGKVEHLIRMRERLDEHSRYLESQLAGLENLVQERGESDVVVPPMPEQDQEEA